MKQNVGSPFLLEHNNHLVFHIFVDPRYNPCKEYSCQSHPISHWINTSWFEIWNNTTNMDKRRVRDRRWRRLVFPFPITHQVGFFPLLISTITTCPQREFFFPPLLGKKEKGILKANPQRSNFDFWWNSSHPIPLHRDRHRWGRRPTQPAQILCATGSLPAGSVDRSCPIRCGAGHCDGTARVGAATNRTMRAERPMDPPQHLKGSNG